MSRLRTPSERTPLEEAQTALFYANATEKRARKAIEELNLIVDDNQRVREALGHVLAALVPEPESEAAERQGVESHE